MYQYLNQIKKTLKDGYLIGIGTLSSSWNFSVVASGKHAGEVAIDRCDASSGIKYNLYSIIYDNVFIERKRNRVNAVPFFGCAL